MHYLSVVLFRALAVLALVILVAPSLDLLWKTADLGYAGWAVIGLLLSAGLFYLSSRMRAAAAADIPF